MRDINPFLVPSPRAFNNKTALVIGLPMTTAKYNASNPFALVAGKSSGNKSNQTSYVIYHQPKSFDWLVRDAKPHPLGQLHESYFVQARELLNQIIQLT